ncbi:MAG: NAD(P)H-hydrate epimerase, partial [Deltaproteobacteria bacterium]|nr:NAD(P)H-hydrate epimerase [Deltaproteobacteria bacterium]
MIPLLDRAGMRAFDAHHIQGVGVPSLVLMENAGRGAADVVSREARSSGRPAVFLCGPGNNGGDGLVAARHLLARGIAHRVVLAAPPSRLSPDAAASLRAYLGVGGNVTVAETAGPVLDEALAGAGPVVDALFGTGLDRPLVDGPAAIVDRLNRAPGRKIALDLPSGLDATTGAVLGVAVRAAVTVTFGHLKVGQLTGAGAELCGELELVVLGVPDAL